MPLNPDLVRRCFGAVLRAFPEKRFSDQVISQFYDSMGGLECHPNVFQRVMEEFTKADDFPTFRQIQRACTRLRHAPGDEEHAEAVRATVRAFGHEMLAMGSVCAQEACRWCVGSGWWAHMGGDPEEAFAQHVHVWEVDRLKALGRAEQRTVGGTSRWFIDGCPEQNFVHAEAWCSMHAPGGQALAPGATYHPIRARMYPSQWDDLQRRWRSPKVPKKEVDQLVRKILEPSREVM